MKKSSKKQNVKKAGENVKGFFEAGEVIATKDPNAGVMMKNGKLKIPTPTTAVDINAEVPVGEVIHNGVDMHGVKKGKQKKTTTPPAQKKTFQLGTLQTAVMKKAGTPGSWWDTSAGKLRRQQMVQDMKHGKLMTRKNGKVVKQ